MNYLETENSLDSKNKQPVQKKISKWSIFHCGSFNMTPWSIGVPVNRGIQPLKCEQTNACHAIIIITEQVRTLLKLLGVCEVCQELEFYNELDASNLSCSC